MPDKPKLIARVQELIDSGNDWYKVSKRVVARITLLDRAERVTPGGFLIGKGFKVAVETSDHVCVRGFAAALAKAIQIQDGLVQQAKMALSGATRDLDQIKSYTSYADVLSKESQFT
jgi:hypothetical protein